MRVINVLKNSFYGFFSQILIAIIGLITRSIFLKCLGEEYLGLNGLFTNIISVLSLAELGFGSAALYALYKPLANGDKDQVAALMGLYKKIYHVMFIVVLVIGLAITPLIPSLIKDTTGIKGLYSIYFIFVLDSAISYLFAYKRSILFADQKNYIIIKISTVCKIFLSILQIIMLVITKNFIFYLISMLVMHFAENFIISIVVDKRYSYINEKHEKLEKSIKHELLKNTKALVLHKIGTIAVFSTDNIITSAFIGIGTVGIYSGYTMLISQVDLLVKSLQEAVKASIGNYSVNETSENKYRIFKQLNLIIYLIYSFCTISFLCLFNHFISLWLGSNLTFSFDIVFLICFNFYIKGMRNSLLIVKETNGIFNEDKWKPIMEAVCNLVLSIILVQKIGFAGVILGTIITTLLIPYLIEPYVTFKYALNRNFKVYYKTMGYNYLTFFLSGTITLTLCNSLMDTGFIPFVIKVVICAIVPNILNMLFYCRSEELKSVAIQLKAILYKKK